MGGQNSDYLQGSMEIAEQKATFSGFLVATQWGAALTALVVLFLSLVFGANLPWVACLFGVAALGIVMGLVMRMGGAWFGTVVGLTILGLIAGGISSLVAALS
jgi:hypothetical protein